MASSTPRDYIVIVEITTKDKSPWEETHEVSAYEIGEALMTVSVRLTYQYGDKVSLRVKDAKPRNSDLNALIAETMSKFKRGEK